MEFNPTKFQLFLRKRIYWKAFFNDGFVNYFSLSDGFGSIDIRKPGVREVT